MSLIAAALAASALVQGGLPDEDRWAWRYRRAVTVAGGETLGILVVPPEVATRCRPDLNDLRLLAPDGGEVPYVLDRAVAREVEPRWPGMLLDTRREARASSAWVVDLGEPRTFDRVELDVRQRDFAKRIRVESSSDARTWATVAEDQGIFDRPWTRRVHHTTITFAQPVRARYLRLTADDRKSRPVEVLGVSAAATRHLAGHAWRRPVAVQPLGVRSGWTRYRLDLPSGFPLEAVELDADDAVFSRDVVLREAREVNGRREETVLGDGQVYRVSLEAESLSAADLELPVRRPRDGELILEIADRDSPPLHNLRLLASAPATRLLFPAASGATVLYYGNEATRPPVYDLERLRDRLSLETAFARAALADEVENPRFRRAPPLSFAAARGASLDVSRWRFTRRLTIPQGQAAAAEDLFTLSLAPEDLGPLRPDLGDLRVVDEAGRQVPYVLEPSAAEKSVVLSVRKTGDKARTRMSRYQVGPPGAGGADGARLPWAALELQFTEAFFSRPVRLLARTEGRRRERVVYSGRLARDPARVGTMALPAGGEPDGAPLVIALDGTRVGELVLEIEDGDNEPLTVAEARAVVRVPRLAFKAAGGDYRLLMGNPDAEAPRYDIASLRQEILAYSALRAEAVGGEPNPAYRRGPADYLQQAPPTVLLWGTLVVSVLALLFLTARIVRSTPQ